MNTWVRVLAWIAVVGGLAILAYEMIRGDVSLVGPGVAVVGALVLYRPRSRDEGGA